MGIFDITDSFDKKLNNNELDIENLDQYINGVKEHTQPLVSFVNDNKDVIYREQLQKTLKQKGKGNKEDILYMNFYGAIKKSHPKNGMGFFVSIYSCKQIPYG